jgi:hypothetical protein
MSKTKKNPKTKFYFLCPIFGASVCLTLGEIEKEKPLKIFGAGYTPNEDSLAETTVIRNESGADVGHHVWVKDKTDYHSMVHETLHLVSNILNKKQIPFNSDNQELIAYYQNYWVRKFWNKMCKFIKD